MRHKIVARLAPAIALIAALFAVQYSRSASAQNSGLISQGRQLFLTGCVSCHGAVGVGTDLGPSLIEVGAASADFQLSTGRMPAANGKDRQATRKPPAYTPDEIQALVAYVASLGPGPAIPVVDAGAGHLAAGGVIFRAQCASCHNSAGIGGALSYGRHAPSLDEATDVQVVEAIRVGPGQMPVFNEQTITADEANDVAAYVRYLHSPRDRGGISLGRVGPITEGFVALLFGLGGLCVLSVWIVGRPRA
jgi:ubiquinol-cytochrome c reductase cytochrome c subunit